MAVTAADVAVELGVTMTSDLETQWERWIDRALRLIERRATRLGVESSTLNAGTIDDVVLLAVTEHARNPDGVDSYDIAIDDGRETRRYRHSAGQLTITDEWWSWLFPSSALGVFTTLTYGTPDIADPELDWS